MYGPLTFQRSIWSDCDLDSHPSSARRLMHQSTAGPILLNSTTTSHRMVSQTYRPSSFAPRPQYPPMQRTSLPWRLNTRFTDRVINRSHSAGADSTYAPFPNDDEVRFPQPPRSLRQYIPIICGWVTPTRAAATKIGELCHVWKDAAKDSSIFDALLTSEADCLKPLKALRPAQCFEMAAKAGTATPRRREAFGQRLFSHARFCRCRTRLDEEKCNQCGEGQPSKMNNFGTSLASARTTCSATNGSQTGSNPRRALPIRPFATALYEFREAKTQTIESAPQSRESILHWMSRVIETMGWPLSAFFTAVHAFDVSMASGVLLKSDYIPRISTSCVLIGVCSECDHKQMTKARWFVNQVPHVNNVRDLIISEMFVVSYLKGGSLMHKTPIDFTMLYLEAIDQYALKFETMAGLRMSIWEVGLRLNTHNINSSMVGPIIAPATEDAIKGGLVPLVETLVDLLMCISVYSFINMIYPVLDMSKLIATVILDVLMIANPAFCDYEFTHKFCEIAFRLDVVDDILPLWHDLASLYQACKTDSTTFMAGGAQRRFPGWSPRVAALLDHLLSMPRDFPQPHF